MEYAVLRGLEQGNIFWARLRGDEVKDEKFIKFVSFHYELLGTYEDADSAQAAYYKFLLRPTEEELGKKRTSVTIVDNTPDPSVLKEVICKNCGVKLSYVPNDVTTKSYTYMGELDSHSYIECPACEHKADV